jgi:hypothetical protein
MRVVTRQPVTAGPRFHPRSVSVGVVVGKVTLGYVSA